MATRDSNTTPKDLGRTFEIKEQNQIDLGINLERATALAQLLNERMTDDSKESRSIDLLANLLESINSTYSEYFNVAPSYQLENR